MSNGKVRIRGYQPKTELLYPSCVFPDYVINGIGKKIVHRIAVGHADITGDDFGEIFSSAINGNHFGKPIGLADVQYQNMCWSVKTVKHKNPSRAKAVRLISGRNSPNYSSNIQNPLEDIQKTGASVLNIWNERVNQAKYDHDILRTVVLVRNMDNLEFALFEYDIAEHHPPNYFWKVNSRGNLEGFEKNSNSHKFTWQPHGSQFTIIKDVPGSVCKFKIKRPSMIPEKDVLMSVGFKDEWIERMI